MIPAPAGAVIGDTLLAFLCNASQVEPDTFPGWTRLEGNPGSLTGPVIVGYVRLHDGSASYTFSWAAPQQAICGGMCAYKIGETPVTHGDRGGAPGQGVTINAHAQAVNAEVAYGMFVGPGNFGSASALTMTAPPESTQRINGLWSPPDAPPPRAGLVISDEVVVGATEPARSFTFDDSGNPGTILAPVALRLVAVSLPGTSFARRGGLSHEYAVEGYPGYEEVV